MKNVHNPVERSTKTNKIFILELHQRFVYTPVVYTSKNKERQKREKERK